MAIHDDSGQNSPGAVATGEGAGALGEGKGCPGGREQLPQSRHSRDWQCSTRKQFSSPTELFKSEWAASVGNELPVTGGVQAEGRDSECRGGGL